MKFAQTYYKKWILETLKSKNIYELTEIQNETLIRQKTEKSMIITSKTGSGKTYCYLLPMLQNIDESINQTQAVIILPTKELARQVYSKILDFVTYNKNLKTKLLVANTNSNANKNLTVPHIVVGTVSKIHEFVIHRSINTQIKYFILDEADMLIDFGFYQEINRIFTKIKSPSLVKIALSATLHKSLANYIKNIFGNTKVISTSNSIWVNDNITHSIVYQSSNNDAEGTLFKFLKKIKPYFCLIFANTKKEANEVYKRMITEGYNVALFHQDLSPRERKNVYKDLIKNKFQYVVATDLIARGIDLPSADVVISYGLPKESIWYIHRTGRVGRNNSKGEAYVIYNPQIDFLINNLTKKEIKWNFLLVKNNGELVDKALNLKVRQRRNMLDYSTNQQIKRIIGSNSKKVKPGYKKKIKIAINKIKQKKKHEYIEKKIKQHLLEKNIKRTKRKK